MKQRLSQFIELAMPFSHWGQRYFDIRLKELMLIDSLLDEPIRSGGERFLDFGCGLGFACVYASTSFAAVDGIDLDGETAAFNCDGPAPVAGMRIIERLGLDNAVHLAAGDSLAFLRQRAGRYDMILSVFCLEHVEHIVEACELIAKALKPGGRVVHIVPNTHDTVNQLLQLSLNDPAENEASCVSTGRGPKKMGTLYAPITHSEFIDDYRQQFEVNSLEHYLFPMMDSGLVIRKVTAMREPYAVLATKP